MSLIQTGIDCLTGTNGLTVYGPPPSSGTNGLHVDASAFAPRTSGFVSPNDVKENIRRVNTDMVATNAQMITTKGVDGVHLAAWREFKKEWDAWYDAHKDSWWGSDFDASERYRNGILPYRDYLKSIGIQPIVPPATPTVAPAGYISEEDARKQVEAEKGKFLGIPLWGWGVGAVALVAGAVYFKGPATIIGMLPFQKKGS